MNLIVHLYYNILSDDESTIQGGEQPTSPQISLSVSSRARCDIYSYESEANTPSFNGFTL